MNKGKYIWPIGIAAVLLALFIIPRFTDPNRGLVSAWNSAGITCMGGHSRAIQHFHPHVTIIVDGLEENIPANVGLVSNCMAEIHTHDTSGTVHVEAPIGDKQFYLRDFFTVYGQALERPGYAVSMRVDGKPSSELDNLLLKDEQKIELIYTRQQ
jgi:hypothetical protein